MMNNSSKKQGYNPIELFFAPINPDEDDYSQTFDSDTGG